ncbi:MAG TPA: T9SS type A sorting domain-containing protein [Chitinophagaceae bacterium]|nr:T9SS type A sorting domain-containing protein [Chitinophagaceae bacterium]
MKKNLKLLFTSLGFTFLLCVEKANAQCTVNNIVIQNVTIIASTATSCTIKFDETFNMAENNGNKLIFIHAWLQSDYPDYFHCVNGQTTLNGSIHAPLASDLGNTYFNIGIDNTGAVPTVLATYPADPSVLLATMDSVTKTVLADGTANYTLYGVVSATPLPCPAPYVVVADLWSTQAANGQRAHCVSCGIKYSIGYLTVNGFVNCTNLTWGARVNNNTGITLDGYYRVFADVNGDGYFTPTSDTLLQGNTTFTIGANSFINISGPVPAANLNQNVFLVFTQTTGGASGASRVILLLSTQCAPLAATFASLSANRINASNVLLKWETLNEINNSGFIIQRNMDNINWENGSFVNTQALAGNSSTPLFYTVNDINSNKGITQYRIKQVDIDGRSRFSETRLVRGSGQSGKVIVYPNPSPDGRVNVVFEDNQGIRDITLSDISGRKIRQWNGVNNNTLQVENLGTGIYTLSVMIRETGDRIIEKIVVIKH